MSKWLQKRLDKLNITHEELAERLENEGIERVRATITGWTNGNRIALLSDPDETEKLAKVLELSVDEMLVQAGYKIGRVDMEIPPPFVKYINRYNRMAPEEQAEFLLSLDIILRAAKNSNRYFDSDAGETG